jgi:hypothetical protein
MMMNYLSNGQSWLGSDSEKTINERDSRVGPEDIKNNKSELSTTDGLAWMLMKVLLLEFDHVCFQIPELCFSVPLTLEDFIE